MGMHSRKFHNRRRIRKHGLDYGTAPNPVRTHDRAATFYHRFEKKWNLDERRVAEMVRNTLIVLRGVKSATVPELKRKQFEQAVLWFRHYFVELKATRTAIRNHLDAEKKAGIPISKSDRELMNDFKDRVSRWTLFMQRAESTLKKNPVKD